MVNNLTNSKKELHSKQILLTFLKNKKDTFLPIIIVFCLPVLLYLQTLSFGFTYFDDNEIIINNITFLSDFRNAPQAFLKDALLVKSSYLYRPLQTLSYMVDIHLSGGNNTWMFHLTNILLLGLIACLLFILFRQFLIPLKLALLSTLVYCVHPLFISSIAWIPARGDLLLSFFSLLSFLFFIELLQKRKVIYLFLHWLTFTIALFCKETAVFLPFLFITYYFTFSSETLMLKRTIFKGTSTKEHEDILQEQSNCMRVRWRDLWAVLRERSATKNHATFSLFIIVLYAISGIFWFWLHSIAIRNFSIWSEVGLISQVSNLQTIPESLAKFFLPFDFNQLPSFSLSKTLIGLGIIFMIIVFFFKNKERTKREKVFCFSWFLILLLPTMFYKVAYIDYLCHRFFLPLIGILLFVLFIFPKKWFEKKDTKSWWLMVAIFVFLSSLTFVKSRSYSDPMTFYNSAISQNPNYAITYNNRGHIKDDIGDFQGAFNDYTKAIELDPGFSAPYFNRGNAYYRKGDLENAIKDYDKTIGLNHGYAKAYNNRGLAYYKKGDLESAIKNYNKAIGLNAGDAKAYNYRGLAYYKKGDFESAIKDYDEAIKLNPNYTNAYCYRGSAYQDKGEQEKAIKDYDKAIALNPNYADAYNNLGTVYQTKGELEKAIKDYDKAIILNPNFADAYYNRGNAYQVKGDLEKAIKDYDKAIELNPNDANTYNNRGLAYKAKGLLDNAEQDFKKYEKLRNK